MKKLIFILATILATTFSSCDVLKEVADGMATSPDPTNSEIASGLKQALTNGALSAVNILGKEGGYFNDPLVKIPFPQEAQFAANTLRDIGLGQIVDNFEKKLNEGAEEGAKLALPIFKKAITSMSFNDVMGILTGGENAATNYFKDRTQVELTNAFGPKIKQSLDKVNATKAWTDVTTKYNSIPLVRKKVDTDLVSYTTGKALDGLFLKLADEEKLIREQPIARTTELLKKVFSFADRKKAEAGG